MEALHRVENVRLPDVAVRSLGARDKVRLYADGHNARLSHALAHRRRCEQIVRGEMLAHRRSSRSAQHSDAWRGQGAQEPKPAQHKPRRAQPVASRGAVATANRQPIVALSLSLYIVQYTSSLYTDMILGPVEFP